MDGLLLVGEADNLGDLADELEPGIGVERVLARQVMIEPDAGRIVFEDQGGAEFVLGEPVGPEMPG